MSIKCVNLRKNINYLTYPIINRSPQQTYPEGTVFFSTRVITCDEQFGQNKRNGSGPTTGSNVLKV